MSGMESTNQAALIRKKKKELDLAEILDKCWANSYATAEEKAEKKERVEIVRRELASLQQGMEGNPINLSDDEDDGDNDGAGIVDNIIEETGATVPDINILCAGCGVANRSLRRCGRCRSVHYCNRECQRGHWSIHRLYCSQI